MRFVLGALALVCNSLDNLTTFFCLRAPIEGFQVIEANPFARWLFEKIGLTEGLAFEAVLTTGAIAFLVLTPRIPKRPKILLLSALVLLPAWAAINNLHVMNSIGWTFAQR